MKEKVLISIVIFIVFISLVFMGLYAIRAFNAATVQTNLITPKDGIECVVVSATDSTSVDCWRL